MCILCIPFLWTDKIDHYSNNFPRSIIPLLDYSLTLAKELHNITSSECTHYRCVGATCTRLLTNDK